MDQRSIVPPPVNDPVRGYGPGSPERLSLVATLDALATDGPREAVNVIDGEEVRTGDVFTVTAPHDHGLTLAEVHAAGTEQVHAAIGASLNAAQEWASLPWEERASVFLRAAELLAGPWRDRLNASTMLGQSKTVVQAEIDAACELVDFFRFNAAYYEEILTEQPPVSPNGFWNRSDWRPLEGFVLALTPFNFTSIAANLCAAPAMLGNTVVWKPSEKQAYSAQFLMDLFRAAGLPDGVINLVHGDGKAISDICLSHRHFAGLHFTGSSTVFKSLWRTIGSNLDHYVSYPRIVGETGGKDFVAVHASADIGEVTTALVRGAFEFQGQKCSAASRAYVPKSLWEAGLEASLRETTESLTMGDVRDLSNFMGAVIDRAAFQRHTDAIAQARSDSATDVIAGGQTDDADGWFVRPTIVQTQDPKHELMARELFGPILTLHVYDDGTESGWEDTLTNVDTTSPYALTGAIFAQDRGVIDHATERLRHAAGNFYVNDKPTGAVVGQQPFGGARASGTNDKAGSKLNLYRWLSARSIKETFVPPTDHRYPHMEGDDV